MLKTVMTRQINRMACVFFVAAIALLARTAPAASAANAYVSVSCSAAAVGAVVADGKDFYVATRNAGASFRATVSVSALSPFVLVSPAEGSLNLGVGDAGSYLVRDDTGLEDSFGGNIEVLQVDIEQSEANVCWKSTTCSLNLTSDSHPGGDVIWTSSPAGISGRGRAINFNPSSLEPGEYTVTARSAKASGCSDSCIVRVVKIETETVAKNPSDRSRLIVGVGEEVVLWRTPPNGAFHWEATKGVLVSSNSNITLWRAPHNAGQAEIFCSTTDGRICSVRFSVLEPVCGFVQGGASPLVAFAEGQAGAGMIIGVYLAPLTVSFRNVDVVEVGAMSTDAVGYFADETVWPQENLDHGRHGAGNWVSVSDGNHVGRDLASSGVCQPPWSHGSFSWPIPANWRVRGDSASANALSWSDQHFAIDSSGSVAVSKFGHTVTRMTNGVYGVSQ